ncbi:hypothetical protein B0J12DRAFT_756956 [Macrophomina phaseolina]|uniref:Uncharacterized protein n=1 Tax=Macrophomina phaseolina TaxID=35725 RepID=A0ABQ8G5N5_9PEZI|nr:hypothetical protein B0J12DRAFT_756956 [Macrophomina phaseolina]
MRLASWRSCSIPDPSMLPFTRAEPLPGRKSRILYPGPLRDQGAWGGRGGESSTANHPVLCWPRAAAHLSLGCSAVTAFCHINDTRKRTRKHLWAVSRPSRRWRATNSLSGSALASPRLAAAAVTRVLLAANLIRMAIALEIPVPFPKAACYHCTLHRWQSLLLHENLADHDPPMSTPLFFPPPPSAKFTSHECARRSECWTRVRPRRARQDSIGRRKHSCGRGE